jgi:hypothetical protein
VVYGRVRFKTMALVNEVKGTGTVTELSVYLTGGGMRKKGGGEFGSGTEGETR